MLTDAQIKSLPKPTRAEAARFLSHATLGYSLPEVDDLVARGYDAWLTTQFSIPNSKYLNHFDWLSAKYPFGSAGNEFGPYRFTSSALRRITEGGDTLRQKMTFALSQVATLTATVDLGTAYVYFLAGGYYDILQNNAFGNYRALLEGISRSPAMARFLTFLGSRKAQGTEVPDENYAREIQQLFTLGVEALDPVTGVPVINAATGRPYEPYGRPNIVNLAKIFTGWEESAAYDNPARFNSANFALTNSSTQHDTSEIKLQYTIRSNQNPSDASKVYAFTVPAGADALSRLRVALDGLFGHPNVAPFVSKQLIQRFTTSSPSATYVRNVAAVFNNNGAGIKGDLKAVIKAILFDESLFVTDGLGQLRRTGGLASDTFGKLREPFARLTQWARAFGATSKSGRWDAGYYGDSIHTPENLGQAPLHAPSVFNFYRSGYVSPSSVIAKRPPVTVVDGATTYVQPNLAPEFQITDEVTTVAYVNFMADVIDSNIGVSRRADITSNYSAWLSKSASPASLVSDLNLLLTANRLSQTNIDRIVNAVSTMPAASDGQKRARVQAAILLIMASPEYLVQK